jgi:penicillin amidase
MRINRDLRADSAFTPDKIRRMQLDPGSARADAFVPILLDAARAEIAAGRGDPELNTSEKLLAGWDRQYTKSSRQAAFFELVMDQVSLRTWDELVTPGDSARGSPVNVPEQSVLLELMSDPGSVWWDNRGTRDIVETRDMILAESMRAALRQGIKSYGDPGGAKWEWSARRTANIKHLFRINSFSRLGIPIQSGPSTIAPSTEDGVHGPSWRMVVELGPEVRAWGIYPGGQSGNPLSGFYADRISKWSNGQLDQLLFPKTSAQIPDSRISSRLELRKQ